MSADARLESVAARDRRWAAEYAVGPNEVYVTRPVDRRLLESIAVNFTTLVEGSRMTGKSSLLLRTQMRLVDWRRPGDRFTDMDVDRDPPRAHADLTPAETVVAYIDISQVSDPSAERFAFRILSELRRSAGEPDVSWEGLADRSLDDMLLEGCERLATAMEASNRPRLTHAIVMLDEVDSLEHKEWSGAFLAALAGLTAKFKSNSHGVRLRFVLASVKPIRFVVDDPASSAYLQAEKALWMDDFGTDDNTVNQLAGGFPDEMNEHAFGLTFKAIEYTGGYPQATTWMCQLMKEHSFKHAADGLETRMDYLVNLESSGVNFPQFLSDPQDFLLSYARGAGRIADNDPLGSVISALWNYRRLLAKQEVNFSGFDASVALLCWAGLTQRVENAGLKLRGRLLGRHYNSEWASYLAQTLSTRQVLPSTRPPSATQTNERNVVVFTTGGTIGMKKDEKTGLVSSEIGQEVFSDARAVVAGEVEVDRLLMLDSANVVPDHWEQIADRVASALNRDDVAGVVVLHGTDTLAYTASAVAFALGERLSKPVVFTGSQAPAEVPWADASVNMARACKIAADGIVPEVVICFGDKVIRACQAQKRDDRRFDAFESPFWRPLATVTEEIYYDYDAFRPGWNQRKGALAYKHCPFDKRILTLVQVPGLRPELLEPVIERAKVGGVSGIVIQSLGAGNLPTTQEYSLIELIDRAIDAGIPVVIGSMYPIRTANVDIYEPSRIAVQTGAVRAFNMTLPAIVTKLAWLLGRHAREEIGLSALDWVGAEMLAPMIGEIADSEQHQQQRGPA